jgi:hypothetical protein
MEARWVGWSKWEVSASKPSSIKQLSGSPRICRKVQRTEAACPLLPLRRRERITHTSARCEPGHKTQSMHVPCACTEMWKSRACTRPTELRLRHVKSKMKKKGVSNRAGARVAWAFGSVSPARGWCAIQWPLASIKKQTCKLSQCSRSWSAQPELYRFWRVNTNRFFRE